MLTVISPPSLPAEQSPTASLALLTGCSDGPRCCAVLLPPLPRDSGRLVRPLHPAGPGRTLQGAAPRRQGLPRGLQRRGQLQPRYRALRVPGRCEERHAPCAMREASHPALKHAFEHDLRERRKLCRGCLAYLHMTRTALSPTGGEGGRQGGRRSDGWYRGQREAGRRRCSHGHTKRPTPCETGVAGLWILRILSPPAY